MYLCIFHVCEKKAVAKQQKNPSQQLDWFDSQKKATKVTPLNLERWKNTETAALRPFSLIGAWGEETWATKKGAPGCSLEYIGDDTCYPIIYRGLFHKTMKLQGSRNLNRPGWLMERQRLPRLAATSREPDGTTKAGVGATWPCSCISSLCGLGSLRWWYLW